MALEDYTDQQIVSAIIRRDTFVTKKFLYEKCLPLFRSLFDKYDTGYENCFELANEIYVFIMMPKKNNGLSKLEEFKYECSLMYWLKIVAKNYCLNIYSTSIHTNRIDDTDRNLIDTESLDIDLSQFNMEDLSKILKSMSNERFRRIIQLHYVEEKSNKETAAILGISMENYYNKHLLAKKQFCQALREEGLL